MSQFSVSSFEQLRMRHQSGFMSIQDIPEMQRLPNYFIIEIITFILKSSTFDQVTLSSQELKTLWNSGWLEKQSDVLNDLISDSMFSADYSVNSKMEFSDGPHKASEIVTRARLKMLLSLLGWQTCIWDTNKHASKS